MTTFNECRSSEIIRDHEWLQTVDGEQYCKHCKTIITKSGKWLPPGAGWNPIEPSPTDIPITADMLNLGWLPPPDVGEDGAHE